MKLVDIALKDLLRSFRSVTFYVFGFVVPLLMTGLFYLAFGGLASEEGPELPQTRVLVVNQDEAVSELGGFSLGKTLVDVLSSDGLSDLLQVTRATDAAGARNAVDRQEAHVALIIPIGFSAAVLDPAGRAEVELYQDPTLTLGPGIVKGIVTQVVDGFSGSKIAADVVRGQLEQEGVLLDPLQQAEIARQYAVWAAEMGADQQAGGGLITAFSPAEDQDAGGSFITGLIGQMMAGLMVFYAFFTGASSAQSILQEDEGGTLPRLFTTPTAYSAILGGKFLAVLLTLIVQIVVLILISSLVFGIHWGAPLPVLLVGAGMTIGSAGYGIFVISLLRNSRQGGMAVGGAGTGLGMVGMFRAFTSMIPNAPPAIDTVSLLVPQGWSVYGWQLALEGASAAEVMLPVGVALAVGVALFALGVLRFKKRFA